MWDMDRIAALVDEMFAAGVGSAAAVSIGDNGVEIARLVRGRVSRGGAPLTESTRFDVASLTKPMSTVAIAMVLSGDGRLQLDTPIRSILADAASTGTIGQLLGHAAGCAAHVEFFRGMRRPPVADAGWAPAFASPRRELVERARRHPCGTPGVEAVYSDLGYITLGAIVEALSGLALEDAFAAFVAHPLGLAATFGPVADAVATELDDRGLVCGRVHDENAYYGGEVCGHAGLFASIDDVARFAAAMVDTLAGRPRGRFRTETLQYFVTTSAAPRTSWRLGWDTPSSIPGVSHAGDRWPRTNAIGHLGFTGTSLWLDLPRRRWVSLLTNRVHPTRHDTADAIKALRRAVNDTALDLLDGR